MTNTRTGPDVYTWGLGEVIRGHRLYIGLSRPAMAKQIGVAFRSYERIEDGERACPPGFLDTIRDIVTAFDDAVDRVVMDGSDNPAVHTGEDAEWNRAVMNRAAVASSRITPVLMR